MNAQGNASGTWLSGLGLRLSDWFELWFPDPFVLALLAVAIVFTASLSIGSSVTETVQWFGAGF
jgi:short subunit fatty acids transporter